MTHNGFLVGLTVLVAVTGAQATVVFFDDFEDDAIAANPPVLNSPSIGGDDIADVGIAWASTLAGDNPGVRGGADQYLDLGSASTNGNRSRYADAQFASTALASGDVIVSFEILWDYTGAGSTFAWATVRGGGTNLLDLVFRRGNSGNGGKRIQYNSSNIFVVTNSDTEWHTVTLTLHPTNFDITLAGSGAGTVNALPYANTLTNIDTVRFTTGGANAGRNAYVDDVKVDQIPEPATMSLLVVGGVGVMARRRRRRA